MICLDSWIWLEYLFEGDQWSEAESFIREADAPDSGGIVPATVLAEVSYRIRRQKGPRTASEAIDAIRNFEHIEVLPITADVTEYAAELRDKYYEPGDCELSYADAIHLATAVFVTECDALYSGDPDFAAVDEIETVVL